MMGKTEPRIYTPPLRPLTEETSIGFVCIEYARTILKKNLRERTERRSVDPRLRFPHHGATLNFDRSVLRLSASSRIFPSVISLYAFSAVE